MISLKEDVARPISVTTEKGDSLQVYGTKEPISYISTKFDSVEGIKPRTRLGVRFLGTYNSNDYGTITEVTNDEIVWMSKSGDELRFKLSGEINKEEIRFDPSQPTKYSKYFGFLTLKRDEPKREPKMDPYSRTKAQVYATGNKWAIDNFNATHD